MSVDELEMDEWAALWAEPEQPDEREQLAAVARKVSLRARLGECVDPILAVAIGLAAIAALIVRPDPITVALGIVATLGLLWSTWNRHLLRKRVRAMLRTSDRIELVETEVGRARNDLHRSILGLAATPPLVALFAMLAYSHQSGGSLDGFGEMVWSGLSDVPVGPALAAAAITLVYQQARVVRSLRIELGRLESLSGCYREEARLDRVALG